MKKEFLLKVLMLLFVMSFVSCDKDDDDDNNNGNNSDNSSQSYNSNYGSQTENRSGFENMFNGTSWKMISYKYYKDDGTVEVRTPNPGIMTFSSDHIFYIMGLKHGNKIYDVIDGTWEATSTGVSLKANAKGDQSWASMQGVITANGYAIATITDYTDSWFKCGNNFIYEFSKTSYQAPSNGGGSGSSDSGDAPHVVSYDFTATKTSITVKFMCSERPSSATVKYGTSSPSSTISSSISGKQVTATASGLKAGTKYYFNCTVKNSYGSSTSDTFSAITNY
jgi:hypothetical protein